MEIDRVLQMEDEEEFRGEAEHQEMLELALLREKALASRRPAEGMPSELRDQFEAGRARIRAAVAPADVVMQAPDQGVAAPVEVIEIVEDAEEIVAGEEEGQMEQQVDQDVANLLSRRRRRNSEGGG